ncbi:MAG: 2,3-epoxybenzoyl-CoA dihydrolase [Acidobacteriota bacterium]|nr:2,3-epoxybenzoyl-CoA dihydrolase [Acidobacteriota bacterium]
MSDRQGIDTRTAPDRYRHWCLRVEAPLAYLTLDVAEDGGLSSGYTLKQNSYDLGVDIELYDATQRLRFEHPEVRVVVVDSGKERVFCAGANIGMLGRSTHSHKVNFCKFTNETRLAIEDASECSGQRYLAVISGTAAGGGYELALACDHILLVDDGSAAVSLPEVPLLGVLPGTGGLTRLVDKRKVRRDRADVFCTLEEGLKGRKALDWGLVDELAPRTGLTQRADARARELAATSDRPTDAVGLPLPAVRREHGGDTIQYDTLSVDLDRARGLARLVLRGPECPPPAVPQALAGSGAGQWLLRAAQDLDDALLYLRLNEAGLGLWQFSSKGDPALVWAHEAFLEQHREHWLVREIRLFWKRTLKRLDVSSRSVFALVEPGSCFAGPLLEIVFAADRAYMFEGDRELDGAPAPEIMLGRSSFGELPMPNGLSRLETRFLGSPESVTAARAQVGQRLDAAAASDAGLVTEIFDDIDWDDEIRIAIEERASFSGDSLTGMEASLRVAGPETTETKIFGRLSAWQNWIFQRPNAVGEKGALKRYGTGLRPSYDRERV